MRRRRAIPDHHEHTPHTPKDGGTVRALTTASQFMLGMQEQEADLWTLRAWLALEAGRIADARAHAAKALGSRLDVDLHRAVDLVRRGCSPELALQILL